MADRQATGNPQPFEAESISMPLRSKDGQQTVKHIDVGDYVDHVRIRRVITEGERDISFELQDEGTKQGDYYYVRAVLTNDAVAWSSPIWVGGYKTL